MSLAGKHGKEIREQAGGVRKENDFISLISVNNVNILTFFACVGVGARVGSFVGLGGMKMKEGLFDGELVMGGSVVTMGARDGLFVGELVIGESVVTTGARDGLFVGDLVIGESVGTTGAVVGTFVDEEVGVDVVTAGQNAGLASFKSVCKSSKEKSVQKELFGQKLLE